MISINSFLFKLPNKFFLIILIYNNIIKEFNRKIKGYKFIQAIDPTKTQTEKIWQAI
jgi:hypothetical protein